MQFVGVLRRLGAPIDPDAHRRIRLRRLGLQGAVARLIAEHAYGEARDNLLVIATSPNIGGRR